MDERYGRSIYANEREFDSRTQGQSCDSGDLKMAVAAICAAFRNQKTPRPSSCDSAALDRISNVARVEARHAQRVTFEINLSKHPREGANR